MAKFGYGRVKDLLFFAGSQKVYKNVDIDLSGQHIGYRLSNIKNYRYRPKFS